MKVLLVGWTILFVVPVMVLDPHGVRAARIKRAGGHRELPSRFLAVQAQELQQSRRVHNAALASQSSRAQGVLDASNLRGSIKPPGVERPVPLVSSIVNYLREPEWDFRSCICLKVPPVSGDSAPPQQPSPPADAPYSDRNATTDANNNNVDARSANGTETPSPSPPSPPPLPAVPPGVLGYHLFPSYLQRFSLCRYPFLDKANRGSDFRESLPGGTLNVRSADLNQLAPPRDVPDRFRRTSRTDASSCSRSCAVVGSGSSLLGLRQGAEIDGAEIVIRLNVGPLAGYEEDVGTRTTIRMFYPEAYAPSADRPSRALARDAKCRGGDGSKQSRGGDGNQSSNSKLSSGGSQDGDGSCSGTDGRDTSASSNASGSAADSNHDDVGGAAGDPSAQPLRSKAELYAMVAFKPLDVHWLSTALIQDMRGVPFKHPPGFRDRFFQKVDPVPPDGGPFVLVHPYIVRAVRDHWMREKRQQWPSTGMIAIMVAMMLCEKVTVYGFSSPFVSRAHYGHYYLPTVVNMTGHREHVFEREWALIDEMGIRAPREYAQAQVALGADASLRPPPHGAKVSDEEDTPTVEQLDVMPGIPSGNNRSARPSFMPATTHTSLHTSLSPPKEPQASQSQPAPRPPYVAPASPAAVRVPSSMTQNAERLRMLQLRQVLHGGGEHSLNTFAAAMDNARVYAAQQAGALAPPSSKAVRGHALTSDVVRAHGALGTSAPAVFAGSAAMASSGKSHQPQAGMSVVPWARRGASGASKVAGGSMVGSAAHQAAPAFSHVSQSLSRRSEGSGHLSRSQLALLQQLERQRGTVASPP